MGGLSDLMLGGGCALHVEALHGERVRVLSGPDAGRSFAAVMEVEPDLGLEMALGNDPRGKRVLRFREPAVPRLGSQDVVETDDGKRWRAVRRPDSAYLTVDFDLMEVVKGKDH